MIGIIYKHDVKVFIIKKFHKRTFYHMLLQYITSIKKQFFSLLREITSSIQHF